MYHVSNFLIHSDDDIDPVKQEAMSKRDFPIGCKLKVKYGKGKNRKIYLAKVAFHIYTSVVYNCQNILHFLF